MNTLSKLSFLAMALTLASCNEKVSPELQGANATSTTTGSTNLTPPDEYFFRITNQSDTMLNYKLHRTGAGNANVDCEFSQSLAFSSDLYRANPEAYDISCFLEAEELALHFNGIDFNIEASKNTCEYVGYTPFSYYTLPAGDSSGSYTSVKCDAQTTTAEIQANGYPDLQCSTFVATPGVTTPFSVATGREAEALCRFNYKNQNLLCDIGEISVNQLSFTTTAGVDNVFGTIDDVLAVESTDSEIDCGGKIVNCIEGPIKLEPLLSKSTTGMIVTKAVKDEEYNIAKSLPGLMGVYSSNRRYVNYRRDLASLEIEYGNSGKPLGSAYKSSFGDPIYKNAYEPALMSNYSYNKRMDGTALVTSLPTMQSDRYWAIPYSAEPFLGFGSYRTSPFYTAYCLDNAFEVKARINLVVRDWDRVLPGSATNASFERVSDVDLLPPFARQDIPDTDEVTGDPDSWNAFNDKGDWDDLVSMERDDSNIPYDPSITIWRPLPDATYTTGFFNPAWYSFDKIIEQ